MMSRLTIRCSALAVAVSVLASSATNTPALAAAESNPARASAVAVTPARISNALASLDALAERIQRLSGVPGMAIAVVHDGNIVYAKGFGVRRIGTGERVDPGTVFQLASVSKSIAATVVAGVAGQGRVKWSDPVAKYLPSFTLSDPYVASHATIADLFAHRSGLPDHAGDTLEDLGYDRTEIISKLALLPLDPFRITYHYTNFGLTAAAQAVAAAEGTTWEALSQRVIYGPLGMRSTSSRWADYQRATDKAVLHVRTGSTWHVSSREPDAQSPAGGASSSVRDLAKWMILELGGGTFNGKTIVGKAAMQETQQPLIMSSPLGSPADRASFYGLGIGVSYDEAGRVRWSHSGAFSAGAATSFELLPSERLGIVVLTNGTPSGVPESIAKSFYDLVEFGKIQRDWYAAYASLFNSMLADRGELAGKARSTHPAPPQPNDVYAGAYANAYFGPATVGTNGAGLTLTLGPKHLTYALKPWNGNTFAFTPAGEGASGVSAVTFVPGNGGNPTTMTVEYLNEDGLATFTKP